MYDTMHILVTFDENYIAPFQTMLTSLVFNNPGEHFHIWLLHSAIPDEKLVYLKNDCASVGVDFNAVQVGRELFEHAPISKRYPQEMYYRLLAAHLLPDTLQQILYLDPDILVINSLRPLWETELGESVFAAAAHLDRLGVVTNVNRIRLSTKHDYYNSGVILMDLKKARTIVQPQDIFDSVKELGSALLLPDQDLFNHLYGRHTLPVPDVLWNYDVRNYSDYLHDSDEQCDMAWVMENTVVLHFCSKKKPWKPNYSGRFNVLYKHYMNLTMRRITK